VVATGDYKVVGTRPIRPDGVDKVTGRAAYGADIKLPGMLYARVKRSPHAHARILRIDTSKAMALHGVKAVVTRVDFPETPEGLADAGEGAPVNLKFMVDNLCAGDKVLYRGHAVAAVAAIDPHIAEDALQLIEVDYEALPAVLNVHDAMTEGAPILHESLRTAEMASLFEPPAQGGGKPTNVASHMRIAQGDLEKGFAEADIVIEREFETSMAHQGYIEPHNATALWNSDDSITIWTSTQGAFPARGSIATVLGHPVSKIKVIPMEIGGGFGGKIPVYLEPVAALLSKKTGAPVKMWMTREEVLEGTGPTSGTYIRAKLGAKRDGTFTAAEVYMAFEAGGYPGSPVGAGVMCAVAPYDIPNSRVDGYDVVVNRPKVVAYRAPGSPQALFAVESIVDEIAEQLGIDPLELRLKNAAVEGTRRADGSVFGPIGAVDVIKALQDSPHYKSELEGENRGRGVAIGFWFNVGMESSAYASVNPDGTVVLIGGATDIGGTRAAHAMQLAETLGIPYEDVNPHVGDTESVGFTMYAGGSRTAFAGGWAAYEVGMDIRRQLEERAARIWEVDRESVRYEDGVLIGPDGRRMTFKEIAAQLPHTGGMIQGRANVNPTGVGPAFAGHIADVEVDSETGKVQILRYTAVQDVGTAVHPSYVEGQIQGGVAQGVGMALSEEYFYDENGVMRNSSLLDYRMPTALDLPLIDTILVEVPNPGHPYGVRGVGEVPIVPPLATVANAIHDAVGIRVRKLPASPRAVLGELLDSGA
jgi:CO/xanthine dehydrogenase Mo-binding subunit